jgi:hypothetical protein
VQLLFDTLAGMCFLLETLLSGLYFTPHVDRRRNLRDEVCEANHRFAIRLDLCAVRRAIRCVSCDQQTSRRLWFNAKWKRDIFGHIQGLAKRDQLVLIASFWADYSFSVSQDQGEHRIVNRIS